MTKNDEGDGSHFGFHQIATSTLWMDGFLSNLVRWRKITPCHHIFQ